MNLRSVIKVAVAAVFFLGASLFGGAAVSWGLNKLVQHSAAPYVYDSLERVPEKKVAIVLGARVYADGTPSAALEDRLHTALLLYEAGKVERVLVSGDHGRAGYDEVNAMQRWLVARGVPEKDVFMDHAGFRTFDTMERAREVFHVEEAIICTQAFHLDRSIYLARKSGIDAVGLVADQRRYLRARQDARREYLARVKAVYDVYSPFSRPRFLGEPIPIDGDARATHDKGN